MTPNDSRFRDFLLGSLFFGTILTLIYSTVILTGFSLSEKTSVSAWFPDANGLKEGDVVMVAGHQSGSVSSVTLDASQPDDRRIQVTMEFDAPVNLRVGYRMRISEFTMLGGRVVEIDPGPWGADLLVEGTELVGETGPSALASMGELVRENRKDLREIISNLKLVTDDLASGKGVVGALIADSGLRQDLEQAVQDVAQLTEDLVQGKGTLGMLIEDQESRDQVVTMLRDGSSAMIDLRTIAEDLAAGRGTLGALLADEALREDSMVLIRNLRDGSDRLSLMLQDASKGKGLMGRILVDEALAEDATSFLGDLAQLAKNLRAGQGTVGKLLVTDEAYTQAMQALETLVATLEDAREAQPVSSFASMLFGTTISG
ncbi:MAG: MlaD family protein [Planctomycetes bacterium]|nr:MlaD family protein [Planctomycetota bacterium]